jgi:hypothetical protein
MALDYFPYPEPSEGDSDHQLFLKIATALFLLQQSGSFTQGAAVEDLAGAEDLAGVRTKVNELLGSLRTAGIIAT